MGDRELLELVASLVGLELAAWDDKAECMHYQFRSPLTNGHFWNPLADDGDALRLAVALGVAVVPYPIYAKPKHSVIAKQYNQSAYLRGEGQDVNIETIQVYGDDPSAATRRAIVLAAAAIAKSQDQSA